MNTKSPETSIASPKVKFSEIPSLSTMTCTDNTEIVVIYVSPNKFGHTVVSEPYKAEHKRELQRWHVWNKTLSLCHIMTIIFMILDSYITRLTCRCSQECEFNVKTTGMWLYFNTFASSRLIFELAGALTINQAQFGSLP